MLKSILIAAITSSALSACCSLPGQPRLPLPDRPSRPPVFRHELAPLPKDVYERLVRRELIDDAYIKTLQDIIKTTHQ